MTVLWTHTALADVQAIREHIAQDRPKAAERVFSRILRTANLLAEFPLIGRSGEQADTRDLVVSGSPYLLVYRVRAGVVEILRVIHGRQDWPPEEEA